MILARHSSEVLLELNRSKFAFLVVAMLVAALFFVSLGSYTQATPTHEDDCANCHTYPATSLWLKVDHATVSVVPGGAFTISAEGGGGTSAGTMLKYPRSVSDNSKFSIVTKSVSGTTEELTLTSAITAPSKTGTYTLRLYIISGTGSNANGTSISRETIYQNITVTVTGQGEEAGGPSLMFWGVQILMVTIMISVVTFFTVKMGASKLKETRRYG